MIQLLLQGLKVRLCTWVTCYAQELIDLLKTDGPSLLFALLCSSLCDHKRLFRPFHRRMGAVRRIPQGRVLHHGHQRLERVPFERCSGLSDRFRRWTGFDIG
jgi:hypothetical protein